MTTENLNTTAAMLERKETLDLSDPMEANRVMTRTFYDLQRPRIMAGNQLIDLYKRVIGEDNIPKHEDLKTGKLVMDDVIPIIMKGYREYMKEKKRVPGPKAFKPTEALPNYQFFILATRYVDLLNHEKLFMKSIEYGLQDVKIYTHYLAQIKGVGPAMAAVMLSSWDIHKARYPSSLEAYAGLDQVSTYPGMYLGVVSRAPKALPNYTSRRKSFLGDFHIRLKEKDGERKLTMYYLVYDDAKSGERNFKWEKKALPSGILPEDWRDNYIGEVTDMHEIDSFYGHKPDGSWFYHPIHRTFHIKVEGGFVVSYQVDVPIDGDDKPSHIARGAYSDHLKETKYQDADGEWGYKKSLGYDPYLRSKLLAVLGSSFLKTKSPYADVFYDFRERYVQKESGLSKLHIYRIAMRHTIKVFLIDFYRAWRTLEGLPVHKPYHVAKLGGKEHPNLYKLLDSPYVHVPTPKKEKEED